MGIIFCDKYNLYIFILGVEQECRMIGEMFSTVPLLHTRAIRQTVLSQVQKAEVLHFATHISWKLAAIVLAPGEFGGGTTIHGKFAIVMYKYLFIYYSTTEICLEEF